ncbi:hypothetical protein ACEPAH_9392 [Sanghuangporus vaninii]
MAATASSSQPISIVSRDPQRSANDNLNIPSLHHPNFAGSPMNTSSSSSFLAHPSHLANPRYAGTSPRSAESSTSWSIHPGPLFVSAGSLGSTSGSLGANSISGSAGSFKSRMYPGLGCSPVPVLNPLDPEFKFRGIVGSMESDHGSLIDGHMAQREVEQFRDFTCCGLSLCDLHALVEHFESHHVHVVDPTQPLPHPHPQSAFGFTPIPMYPGDPGYGKGGGSVNGTAAGSGSASSDIPTSTDSSLAGALGPSSSTTVPSNDTANPTGSAPSGFDLDDIDMEMDPEPEHEHDHESATSPAPSASSSSNHSCNSNPNSSSNRSSPLGGGAGPLPLTQPQRFANANGGIPNGTRSSVSSPPDTPLLTTPVSPFATAPATQATYSWSSGVQGQGQGQGQGDGLVGLASNIQSQQGQVQVPAGPSAFDNVTLPAKHIHGGNGMFAHPYASASSARRHYTHPLSPLSSASTSAATSPASASSSSTFAFGNQSQQQRTGLHHTQSLYALRLARHVAEQREREREDLMKRALNGYAGYEDYSRGFPGAGPMDTIDGGIAGAGGVQCTATGLASSGGIARMSVGPTETAIHPGLLFGNGNANANGDAGPMMNGRVKTEPGTTRTTPAQSRSGSPSSPSSAFASASTSSTLASASASTTVSTSGTSTPSSVGGPAARKALSAGSLVSSSSSVLPRSTSSLLLSKPFKCPTPGCTKSYKQANGLKYHVTHGQCSFTPPPELSSISELGLSIGVNLKLGPMGLEGLENMSEAERREAEKEAERRLRPFCCQVKPCTRRYKNMNGLRYHYQHSGEHGMIGLRMLASGRHDATREQSVERSDEEGDGGDAEGGDVAAGERGNFTERRSVERTGSTERGRRRERKEGAMRHAAQTSSAPSTPGPSQLTAAAIPKSSPFTTQAFPGFAQHLQQQQQEASHQHQRSLSGSSGQQQPRSPLSQAFSAHTAAFAQVPFANLSAPNNGFSHMNGGTTNGMMNGMNGVNAMNQYAFAVQSQPASAYASPWGSRAGSPTSGAV